MTMLEEEVFQVYLVARWADGSFLRLPAKWNTNGEVSVNRSDWEMQQPQPELKKNGSALTQVTIHQVDDINEIPVFHFVDQRNKQNGGLYRESRFYCDRKNLDIVPQNSDCMYLVQKPAKVPLTTNNVEWVLLGTLGWAQDCLDDKTAPEEAVHNICRVLKPILSAFPYGVLNTDLRDGTSMTMPQVMTNILKDILEQNTKLASATNFFSGNDTYSNYLAIEEIKRITVHGLRKYTREYNGIYDEIINLQPDMQTVIPTIGELIANVDPLERGWQSIATVDIAKDIVGRSAKRNDNNPTATVIEHFAKDHIKNTTKEHRGMGRFSG